MRDPHTPVVSSYSGRGFDVPFGVEWVHRLRPTRDVFDPANRTLREVLECDGARAPRKAIVVVDSGVLAAWPRLGAQMRAYFSAHGDVVKMMGDPIAITGGEACKNSLAAFQTTLEAIDRHGICRRSYVIAVGGGAVLDAVGFAAATGHRGVRLIRIPTTTLAQDDAAMGVKNGVNLFGKKNFLGAFAPPWAVINDATFLTTLSERDFRSGFSEAVKVALVRDGAFFAQLERDAERIAARGEAESESAIARSAELHLRHITEGGDPFELKEARPLDFGHWSAHKLESMTGFALRHGEAVAIGVMLDCCYSHLLGWLGRADLERVRGCLERLGFALWHPAMADEPTLLAGLEEFREHLGGRLTISLLRAPGRAEDVHEIDRGLMSRALTMMRK